MASRKEASSALVGTFFSLVIRNAIQRAYDVVFG